MAILRNALWCGLLLTGCLLGLQASYLVAQLSASLEEAEDEMRATSRQAQATLFYSQAMFASIRGTAEIVRKSAVEQMGYYEAMGRRSSLALARLDRLIANSDGRIERITQAVESTAAQAGQSAGQIGALAGSLEEDLNILTANSAELMEVSTATVEQLRQRLADDRLDQIAESLTQSSQSTAQATANAAEATGYIRDMLSPTQKSFWRRLLELLIPRPTVNVK